VDDPSRMTTDGEADACTPNYRFNWGTEPRDLSASATQGVRGRLLEPRRAAARIAVLDGSRSLGPAHTGEDAAAICGRQSVHGLRRGDA
jgi:hypothetical protein